MKNVLSIIVTYNRRECLKQCLKSVRNQSYKDYDILVVNNGSNDETTEYLAQQDGLTVINQPNVGGAGGFYSGMKYGYEKGYKWLWLMDDDGIPEEHQLEEIMKYRVTSLYLNALVQNKDNHSKVAFPPHDTNYTPTKAKEKVLLP